MAQIRGAIDWFKAPNVFFGWAHSETDGTSDTIEIRATLNGNLVGSCVANIERAVNNPARGFMVEISGEFSPIDLLNDKLVITASTPNKEDTILPIYSKLQTEIIAITASKTLEEATDEDFARIIELSTRKSTNGIKAKIKSAVHAARSGESIGETLVKDTKNPELSPFNILVGTLSTNKTVAVGRDGHLFLVGGSNGLIDQFNLDINDPKVDQFTTEWKNLISKREKNIRERGINFLQIIIPEKISVLSDLFPVTIKSPTPYLISMKKKIEEDKELRTKVYDAYDTLHNSEFRLETYRKLDSHMTAKGNQIVFQKILEMIGVIEKIDFPLNRRLFHAGDMSMHFPGIRIGAYDDLPDTEPFKQREEKMELVESYFPPDGGHMGRKRVWKNEGATIPLKVVVFGNSFFEMGTQAISLSWWFARWFKEFHFLWEADLDYDYVDRVKPDLVVCQTIERFLVRVPNA